MNNHKILQIKNLKINSCGRSKNRRVRNPLHPEVKSKLRELKKILKKHDSACWVIGDACIELMDKYYLTLKTISDATNYTKARISHLHLTARAFPPDKRDGYTFQDSLSARQIHHCMPRLNMSIFEIREHISKLSDRSGRSVRAHFVKLMIDFETNSSIARSAKLSFESGNIVNNCYNSDWRDIIPKLPDNSVKLFIADPPFGGYCHTKDGSYSSFASITSGLRSDCDFKTTQQAIEVTLPLFEICKHKIAKNGVLLLFQAGARADNPHIILEAEKQGWECKYSLDWFKGSIVVGDNLSPYNICTEKILLFIKKGDRVLRHQNGTPSSVILDYPTETKTAARMMDYGKIAYGDYHQFQKPEKLMDFLVRTHTYPGDLVVETFGCSGSGVIAAIKNQRKWIYIESNKRNFEWGSERIEKLLSNQKFETG